MSNKPSAHHTSSSKSATESYNANNARAAFNALLPRYKAFAPEQILRLNADPELVAVVAVGVALRIAKGPLHDKLMTLPRALFDPSCVTELPKAAWGLRYAAIEAAKTKAHASDAKVPEALIERATKIEARMQRCCEYHLGDDPVVGPELDRLRPGTSHRDLANDLLGYAAIYETHKDALKHDKKHYRASDVVDAAKVSNEIVAALGASFGPQDKVAADNLARAATYLMRIYDEVAAAGRWVLRNEADADEIFPSLIALGRPNRKRGKKKDDAAEETDGAAEEAPEKPAAAPEKAKAEPEKPAAEPEKAATEPSKPATDPEKPAADPQNVPREPADAPAA